MGTIGTNTLVSVLTHKSSEFSPIWKQGCSDVISRDQIITVRGRFQSSVTRKCLWKRKKKTGVVTHTFNSNTPGAGRTLGALGQSGPQRNRGHHETGKAKSGVGSYNLSNVQDHKQTAQSCKEARKDSQWVPREPVDFLSVLRIV